MKKLFFVILFSLICLRVEADSPNIILMVSDDQSWCGLSCRMHPDMPDSKSPVIETPNIAKLATQGMRFSAAYSPSAVCSPSRISIQTGITSGTLRFTKAGRSVGADVGFKLVGVDSRREISSDEITIAHMLKTAGYRTAHYGKWHLGNGGPEGSGYDDSDGNTNNFSPAEFFEPNPVDVYGMGKRAVAFMKKSKESDKPFFIQMSYYPLHYPENATKELVEKYSDKISESRGKTAQRAAISEDLDRGVGWLIDKVEQMGIADNTYIIYMSDNGGIGQNGNLRGGKGDCWEGGIRVPLIIRGPGIKANSWSHQQVTGFDLLPTFCELAKVTKPIPNDVEGGSFAHLLKGVDKAVDRPRKELVFHFPHYQGDSPHTVLFLGDYKLVRHYERPESDQLFNLKNDINEQNNIAAEMPERTRELAGLLDQYVADKKLLLPTANSQYDPDNVPSLRAAKGKGGKGKGKGGSKGSGRKGKGGS